HEHRHPAHRWEDRPGHEPDPPGQPAGHRVPARAPPAYRGAPAGAADFRLSPPPGDRWAAAEPRRPAAGRPAPDRQQPNASGHIPPGGKVVELQYYTQGIGWRLFGEHIRTDPHGRWRFTYPFQGVHGTIRFALQLSIASEAAYPFASGHSRTIGLVVRGL